MKKRTLLLGGICLITGIIISCEQAQVITPEKLSTLSTRTQSQPNDETSNLQDIGFHIDIDLNHSLEIININPGFEEVRTISKQDCPYFYFIRHRIDTLYSLAITGVRVVPTLESMPYISGYRINGHMNAHTDTYHYTPMYSYESSPVTDNVETVFSEIKIREERPNQDLVHLGVYIEDEVLGKVRGKITGEKYYPYFIGVEPIFSFANYFSNSEVIDNVIKNNKVYLTIENEQSSSFSLKVTILGTNYKQVLTGAEETILIPMSDIYGRLGVVHIGKN